MLECTYSFIGRALFRIQLYRRHLSFLTYKIHSQLQSSRRHFQSSCIAGLCVILRKLLEKNKHIWKIRWAHVTSLIYVTKPPKAMSYQYPCWWLHRSEGQMISQLHYYPVCAYKQPQLKLVCWYSNKHCGTKRLQEKNNMSKVVHFITDLCLM